MALLNLYESAALRTVTGSVIRPGGFQLTERGLVSCRLARDARVLDVGCGNGAAVGYLRDKYGLKAMGLDLSAALLDEGRQSHGQKPLVRGRAEQLPSAGGAFAAVLCECMLSLCPDPQKALAEMRRVLVPGGYLILTDVYTRALQAAHRTGGISVQCCLQGAVDRPTVENRLAAAGFDVVLWEDHTPLLTQLAAELVWTYGSLDAFWSAAGGADTAGSTNHDTQAGCRHPGYYLLVART